MAPSSKPTHKPSPGADRSKRAQRKKSAKRAVVKKKLAPPILKAVAKELETHKVTVEAGTPAARADKILSNLIEGVSRSRVQRALNQQLVKRQGVVIDSRTVLQPGDEVVVQLPDPIEPTASAVKMKLEILFEDEHLIAVNKPAGLLTHPVSGSNEKSLVQGLLYHTQGKLAPAGGAPRPGVVHRLDRETSGVIVLAKTDKAYHSLVEQFTHRNAQKEYLALVDKSPRLLSGSIDANINRHRTIRVRMAVREDGREASTDWRVEEKYGPQAALVRAFPHTGRTHQIRVHLAHIGHAILGDRTYGKFDTPAFADWPIPRVMLHAHRLTLNHPQTGKPLTIAVDPPADFQKLREWLKSRFGFKSFNLAV